MPVNRVEYNSINQKKIVKQIKSGNITFRTINIYTDFGVNEDVL